MSDKHDTTALDLSEFLKPVLWSYNISPEELVGYLQKKEFIHPLISREEIYREILKSYSWYSILKNVDSSILKDMLDDKILDKLFPKSLISRYKYARQFLH